MTNSGPDLTKDLNLGIEAARAGRKQEARKCLWAVLRANPNYIPALFWMAYVAATPQESIQLLERILKLDPNNERAKAGLLWVEQQARGEEIEEIEETEEIDDVTSPTIDRRQLFTDNEAQKRAQKGAMAHRARKTINPFLMVMLFVAGVALMAIGLLALVLAPPATLAAWLPAATSPESAAVVAPPVVAPKPASKVNRPLASRGDTVKIPVQMREMPVQTLTVPNVPAFFKPAPAAEPAAVQSARPDELQGPNRDNLGGPKLLAPVDASLLAHQPASATEKWIEVNLTQQRVIAWEGNVPVMTFLSSTGLPGTPTVVGNFNIYWKLISTLMVGPGYYLPEVPYTMYFYAGYALHGAYWHDNFGQPMSHGCVNLSNENSKKLFEWANPVLPPGQTQVVATADNPGTLVVIHE